MNPSSFMYSTWSGLGIIQPSANLGGSGMSLASPCGAPLATHLLIVALSLSLIRAIVLEMTELGIGVPGGHPLRLHDLFDHVRPACHFLVVGQREGAIWPSRWHETQLAFRIRAICLV